jgi:cytochrome P450
MKTIASSKTPDFLQKLQWILNPTGYLESNHSRYPDLFRAKGIGFGDNVILTSNPEILQYVLTHDRQQFTAPSEFNKLLRPYWVITL